jgi:energy-coupling factor transporter ATP-binding protein EcfA2
VQKDFTYDIYSELIASLKKSGYVFLPFIDFISNNNDCKKCVVIRHDVDRLPENALKMARMENGENVKASYYFRTVPSVFRGKIISDIASLDHEIGYHYEDLSLCRGNYELAIKNFESNLEKFRKIYPVKTICMHGSPLSKYDNKKIWEKYDYRDFGIIAEPF